MDRILFYWTINEVEASNKKEMGEKKIEEAE